MHNPVIGGGYSALATGTQRVSAGRVRPLRSGYSLARFPQRAVLLRCFNLNNESAGINIQCAHAPDKLVTVEGWNRARGLSRAGLHASVPVYNKICIK